MIIPLVLAGGVGTRLWPLSRKNYPKQMLNLIQDTTLLQTTLNHMKSIPDVYPTLIIGNDEHRFILAEQARAVDPEATILLEAKSCDTAAAVAIGTLYAMTKAEDPLVLVLPADHYISDPIKFSQMITEATAIASQGKLVTFGVVPSSPETGYGYIKRGAQLSHSTGYSVEQFVEKPNLETAQAYVLSGDYYWNSGIFLFKASTLLQELKKYSPIVLSASKKAMQQLHISRDFINIDVESMQDCPKIPIDKAIFEKTNQAVVFSFNCEWQDLGGWESLYQIGNKDEEGNLVHGKVVLFNTKNCYLYSNKQLIVASGIKNCLVVSTADAILVARLDKKQDIKKIVEYLIHKKYSEAIVHPITYHSWGHSEITEQSEQVLVKHLVIGPGKIIISALKEDSSVYWLFISGKGQLTLGQETHFVSENEFFCIPQDVKCYLENVEKIPLQLIEIQTRERTIYNKIK